MAGDERLQHVIGGPHPVGEQIEFGQAQHDRRIVRLQAQQPFAQSQLVFPISQAPLDVGRHGQQSGMIAVLGEQGFQHRPGLLQIALLDQQAGFDESQADLRQPYRRRRPAAFHQGLQSVHRRADAACALVGGGEIEIGIGIVRVQRDDLAESGDGRLQAPGQHLRHPAAVENERILRVVLGQGGEAVARLLHPSLPGQQGGLQIAYLTRRTNGRLGMCLQGAIDGQGLFRLAQCFMKCGQFFRPLQALGCLRHRCAQKFQGGARLVSAPVFLGPAIEHLGVHLFRPACWALSRRRRGRCRKRYQPASHQGPCSQQPPEAGKHLGRGLLHE